MRRKPAGSVQVGSLKDRLRLRFSYQGQRHVIALGLPDTSINRTIAEKRAREIEIQIALKQYTPETPPKPPITASAAPPDLLVLWRLYTQHRASQVAETTLRLNYRRIELFLAKCVDRSPKSIILALKLLSPYNHARTLTQLRACCRWGAAEGHLAENPFNGELKAPRQSKRDNIDPFTESEETAILEAFQGQHYYSLVAFLFLTGCRTSEAIGLTWGDISPGLTTITFRSAVVNASGRKIRKGPKTRKIRTIGTNKKLQELLKALQRCGLADPVFVNQSSGLVSARYFNQVWKRALLPLVQAGKIRKYRPQHQTRHTRITRWLTQGVPAHEVARWAGNSPIVIYKHYAGYLGNSRLPE